MPLLVLGVSSSTLEADIEHTEVAMQHLVLGTAVASGLADIALEVSIRIVLWKS